MAEDFKKLLAQKGLKGTNQRLAILDCLCNAKQPITAEEIYMDLKDKQENSCLSTVYRTVEVLCDKSIVEKTSLLDDGKARYEMCHEDHKHHISCMDCHKIIAIDECPFDSFEKQLRERLEFQVVGHKFEIYGYCKSCQSNHQ